MISIIALDIVCFSDQKVFIFFLYLHENVWSEYSLEVSTVLSTSSSHFPLGVYTEEINLETFVMI